MNAERQMHGFFDEAKPSECGSSTAALGREVQLRGKQGGRYTSALRGRFARQSFISAILYLISSILASAVEYHYDGAGRLIGVDWGNGKVTAYTYDGNGNLRNRTTVSPTNADVRVTKSSAFTGLTGGLPFDYVLSAANNGPNPATDVIVADTIPFGIIIRAVRTSQGSCTVSGQTVTCNLGILPVNSTGTVTISALHGLTGTFVNVASVGATQADVNAVNNSSTFTNRTFAPQDSDSDGMPNWWEELYGLNPFSSSGNQGANGNPDGDAFTNLREFFADTNPNNSNDFLMIEQIMIQSPVTVEFDTSPVRQYDVDYNDALTNGAGWIELQGNLEGDGLTESVADPADATNRAYRLEAEIPNHP